jgi:hypothetical protein
METIVERVTKAIDDDIGYYENKVKELKEGREEKVKVAQRLEESFESKEVSIYGSRFSFNPKTSADAFIVTKKLLALFPEIERFSKELDTGNGKWKWVGGVGNVVFVVENATPDVNCVPKERVGTYKTWVCERG